MTNSYRLFKNFGKKHMRFLAVISISICLVTGLTACDLASNHLEMDREKSLSFQDYRDGLAPRELPEKVETDADIPSLQSYVASPSKNLKAMPLVSISVNQTVPLRDALFELAKEADYDIELDSNITGSVIFSARNKPFDIVLDRITEMAGLRYKIDDNTIRIEEDRAFMHNYKIDYLNYVRESSSSISSSTDVVSGDGADTGSDFESSSSSSSDFWAELETGLTQVLGGEAITGRLRSAVTPMISALDTSGEPGIAAQPAGSDVVVQVSSLPAVGPDAASSGAGSGQDALFAMNRHAGIISVYAPQRKHKEVKEYLDQVRRSSTAQVLIEAKVIEVELSENYAMGIDWSELFPNSNDLSVIPSNTTQGFLGSTAPDAGISIAFAKWDLSTTIDAISQFGTTRALSSPRITVLNNQPAALNVATNLVYFELDVEIEAGDDGTPPTTTVSSDIQNVPEGVLINVLPSINLDEQKISLAIRPTITNVDVFEADPAVPLSIALNSSGLTAEQAALVEGTQSLIPVVEVQEFDSVIELNSGQAIIMGGLMQDRVQSQETGVPILSEIPGIGSAFKSHSDFIQKVELVVILKATIIENNNNIHETDREIYNMFVSDRRPFDL